jgi:hypothetical protein
MFIWFKIYNGVSFRFGREEDARSIGLVMLIRSVLINELCPVMKERGELRPLSHQSLLQLRVFGTNVNLCILGAP